VGKINRPLRDAIKEAAGVSTDRSVQLWIKEFRRKHLVSPEQAERMIGYQKGIDIQRFLTEEQLVETRQLLTREGLPVVQVVRQSPTPERKVLKVRSKELEDPLLPPSVVEDARRMAEVYPYLYMFENSVRNFVRTVMEKKHGKDWWEEHVGKAVRDEVEKRIKDEEQNAWHGKRGTHSIHYTSIGDLTKIVKTNAATFAPFFSGLASGLGWLETRINEIELSRNAVAHHRPLEKRDIDDIKRYYEQWRDQLRAWKEKISA